MPPKVSVVITTYHRNQRLRKAIDSVFAQTFNDIELIVVDGSGVGHAEPVVNEYDDIIFVPREVDEGPQSDRAKGADIAEGEYIHFLDDDDEFKPTKIERQIAHFENSPDVGVVYCGKEWEDARVVKPKSDVRGEVLDHALMFDMNPCLPSTMLMRSSVLEKIIPFQHHHGADDVGMKIELAKVAKFDYVNQPLVIAGRSPNSRGDSWEAIEGKKKLLKQYDNLYKSQPSNVKKTALVDLYQNLGRWYLNHRIWSFRAIRSFAKVLYYSPEVSLFEFGEFVSSFGGRPGRHLAAKVWGSSVDTSFD